MIYHSNIPDKNHQPTIAMSQLTLKLTKQVCIYLCHKSCTMAMISEWNDNKDHINVSLTFKESAINEILIPKPEANGCPQGTFDGLNTCYCEDHCSWETCRLVDPPQNCLSKIAGEVVWAWGSKQDAWVAQGKIIKPEI